MDKTLLVSLVSDQTIPNVQLIQEFKGTVTHYLFITTEGMEKKGIRQWTIDACNLSNNEVIAPIIVPQFSFEVIEQKLDQFDFEPFSKVIVNITGGTKVMTLAAFNFFKELGADVFYVTGNNDEMIRLAPGRKKKTVKIISRVSVIQYLHAYGFKTKETKPSNIPENYTSIFFQLFITGKIQPYREIINKLRNFRKYDVNKTEVDGLVEFLHFIEFPDESSKKLSKYQVKYLTGEWFEEYISNKLKQELNLNSDEIMTGLEISKQNKKQTLVPNEMDVLFMWNNKLYTIECKTSVFLSEPSNTDEKPVTKNILGETLYKSDSLKQGLGLYVNTYVFILDSIDEYREKLKLHLERADLYNITIIDKVQLAQAQSIRSLIRI